MVHRRRFITGSTAAVFLASCRARPKTNVITIGGVLPLTGDAAPFGINASKGASLAIDEFNNSANSTKYKWIVEDSAGKPLEAVSAARKLLDINGAKCLIGGVTSSVTHALIPIVTASKTPLLSPSASDPALSGASAYFARVWPSDVFEAEELAAFSKSTGFKKIAAVYINDDYGNGMVGAFEQSGEQEEITKIPYEPTNSDFRTTIQRISDGDFSAIFLVAFPEKAKLFINQMIEAKLELPILATATIEDPLVLQTSLTNEMLFFSSPRQADEGNNIKDNFVKSYTEKYGEEPGVLSDTGYDCAKLIVENYKVNNGLSTMKSILSQADYQGASGSMSFKPNGDVKKKYDMRTITNGKFTWVN